MINFPAENEQFMLSDDGHMQTVLLESRQRWRDMVALACDFVFETDALGCLTYLHPDAILGWPAASLLGRSAAFLLTDAAGGFDPFRATTRVRHRHVWLKRGDGAVACLTVAAEPIIDRHGTIIGTRGIAVDITEADAEAARMAGALRLGSALDHVLSRMGQEILAPRMLQAALDALAHALGAEGAALMTVRAGLPPHLAHAAGTGAALIVDAAAALIGAHTGAPVAGAAGDGGPLLVDICRTRFGGQAGLAAWRVPGARAWDSDDIRLLAASGKIIRMALEHEAIQHEMMRQARTDPLTGLLNRRAFREEVLRHTGRTEQETLPATLVFVDLDHFKTVNDRFGHEVGDEVLRRTASLLRETFRPGDLIARLGGDEFALWLGGADHMTAAERAEALRVSVPAALACIVGDSTPRITLSIGIATRQARTDEDIDGLIRRADEAMYEAKRHGRGHWRVSLLAAG